MTQILVPPADDQCPSPLTLGDDAARFVAEVESVEL